MRRPPCGGFEHQQHDSEAVVSLRSGANRWKTRAGNAVTPGVLLLCAIVATPVTADDAEISKKLKERGIDVTLSKGIATAVEVKDGAKLTNEDFLEITRLTALKSLSLNLCLTDERVAQMTALADLEGLSTNGAQITDDGLKPLAKLKKLQSIAFFHPGKSFSGAGLAHLADLPKLENLTVAGSLAFNDEGMAAVAKLSELKVFRTWHAGSTNEGVKKLTALKNLKNLWLGQRLTFKQPSSPNDETISILTEIKSLESLQLDEARLSFTALQQLKQLPALKKLTLGGIAIRKDEVDRLKKEIPMVKLEWTEPNETYQKRIQSLFGDK